MFSTLTAPRHNLNNAHRTWGLAVKAAWWFQPIQEALEESVEAFNNKSK